MAVGKPACTELARLKARKQHKEGEGEMRPLTQMMALIVASMTVVCSNAWSAPEIPERIMLKESEIRLVDFGQRIQKATASTAAIGLTVRNDNTCLQVVGRKKGKGTITYTLDDETQGAIEVFIDYAPQVYEFLKNQLGEIPGIKVETLGQMTKVSGRIVTIEDWLTYSDIKAQCAKQNWDRMVMWRVQLEPPTKKMSDQLEAVVRDIPGVLSASVNVRAAPGGMLLVLLGGIVEDDQSANAYEKEIQRVVHRQFRIDADNLALRKQYKTLSTINKELTASINSRNDVDGASIKFEGARGNVGLRIAAIANKHTARERIAGTIENYCKHVLGLEESLVIKDQRIVTPEEVKAHLSELLDASDFVVRHSVKAAMRRGKADIRVSGEVGTANDVESMKKLVKRYFSQMGFLDVDPVMDISVGDDTIEIEFKGYAISGSFEEQVGTNILDALSVGLSGTVTGGTDTKPVWSFAGTFALEKFFNFLDENGYLASSEKQTVSVRSGEAGESFVGRSLLFEIEGEDGAGSVQEVQVGFDCKVIPVLSGRDGVSMRSEVQIRTVAERRKTNKIEILETGANTTLDNVPFNGSAVLAMNRRVSSDEGKSGVPILKDIPGVNLIFREKHKRYTESTWFLVATPRLANHTPPAMDPSITKMADQLIDSIKKKLADAKNERR